MTTNICQNKNWTAWVDGTALPNPGRMAIGIVLVAPDGRRAEVSRSLGRNGCNNEAELCAIGAALAVAAESGARHLTLCSDSRFAIDCLSGMDHTAIEPLAGLVTAVRKHLAEFVAFKLCWLPRHRNTDADRLARAALGLLPKKSKPDRRRHR